MEHTPGPWKAELLDNLAEYVLTSNDSRTLVGIIKTASQELGEDQTDTDRANVALMTAAPDLLEACESVLKWLEFTHMADDGKIGSIYANELRAAIRKVASEAE